MVNRKAVSAALAECPDGPRFIKRMMRHLKPFFGNHSRERELSLRPVMLFANSWLSHIEAGDPLGAFLRAMNFDWADVRELAGEPVHPGLEAYRTHLLSVEQHKNPDDAMVAMRLLEKWFSLAAAEHGDCRPELEYMVYRLMENTSRDCLAERVARNSMMRELWLTHLPVAITVTLMLSHLMLVLPSIFTAILLGVNTLSLGLTLGRLARNFQESHHLRGYIAYLLADPAAPSDL